MKTHVLLLALFLFAMPTLSQAASTDVLTTVHQALSYNPTLKSSQEARQAAIHEVRAARAGYLPSLDVWADSGLGFSDNPTTRAYNEEDDTYGQGSVGLSLSQSIWDGGATTASVKSAEATLDSTGKLVIESSTNITFAAISVHVDVYFKRLLLELAKNNVQEHLGTFGTVEQRFRQGISTIGEVEQIRSRLARARTTVLAYEVTLDAAKANYLRIVGVKVHDTLSPVGMPTYLFTDPQEIRTLTLEHNPTIQKNLDTIASLLGEKDYAKSNYAPKFRVEVAPRYYNTSTSRDESNMSVDAMLILRWNLYNGGGDVATVKANAASIRQARQNLHQAMDAINEDIETTFAQTSYASAQAEQMSIAAKSSKKSKASFYEQFLAGKRGLLDVLDAESEAFNASVATLTYEQEHVRGSYRLLALAGTLLNELDINAEKIQDYTPLQDNDTRNYGIEWSTLYTQP